MLSWICGSCNQSRGADCGKRLRQVRRPENLKRKTSGSAVGSSGDGGCRGIDDRRDAGARPTGGT